MTGDSAEDNAHTSNNMDQMNGSDDDGVGRRGKPTMKEVAACFHLPIEVAAKKLGVGQTWLKLLCRSNGVSRWPFRKIQSLQNSLDRSKKMQSLVEVAKVINKNLPKWLDLEGENPNVDIPDGGETEDAEKKDPKAEDTKEEEVAEADPQPSERPVQPLQDVLKPAASGSPSALHSWQLPAKREQEYDLRIKVLGGGLDRAESSIASPKATRCEAVSPALRYEDAKGPNQWQRVLQGALGKQTSLDSSGFGSKSGGAFKPVPQSKPASPPAKMPAPLDLSSFFRVPQPIQLMPFGQDQLPAFAASLTTRPRPLNPYSFGSTQGLEQLLAAAAVAAQPMPESRSE